MIDTTELLEHARELAATRSTTPDIDSRRGVSAAYYATFHEFTDQAARHLIGAAPETAQNRIRRSWSHGELAAVAEIVVNRARTLASNAGAPLTKEASGGGPLVDLASTDPSLVNSLSLFVDLQLARHRADYDHDAIFDQVALLFAWRDALLARTALASASEPARQALFTLLTVRRSDFRER